MSTVSIYPARRILGVLPVLCVFFACAFPSDLAIAKTEGRRPNVIIILCDDLGWGDVRCFNPDGKIPTPTFDRIAAEGTKFTDAHSSSAVCTPSRYSLLTGRYNWRSSLQAGVLNGTSPSLIETGRDTLASFMKRAGFRTACIGKWHLGLNWAARDDKTAKAKGLAVDYTLPFSNGPTSLGFDTFFGISASLDMPPYVYLSQDRTTALPTETRDFPWIAPGNTSKRTRTGPAAPKFEAADVLADFTKHAIDFIREAAPESKKGCPFFLYLPLASPHTPILPLNEWQGRSRLNSYGDFVMQTDAAIGQILAALDESGQRNDTLLIVTSDNGCSPAAEMTQMIELGHKPCADWRGAKADIYEGGHRVPFIVSWPGHVKSGATSRTLIGLQDCFATIAEILGEHYSDRAAEDSVSFLPALMGKSAATRDNLVHHSINGSFAIRQGDWKLVLCPGSGGWSFPRPDQDDTSSMPRMQLFDLASDPQEKRNLQASHPQRIAEMTTLLERIVSEGRSTPGIRQSNTVSVDILRGIKLAQNPKPKKKNRASTP